LVAGEQDVGDTSSTASGLQAFGFRAASCVCMKLITASIASGGRGADGYFRHVRRLLLDEEHERLRQDAVVRQ